MVDIDRPMTVAKPQKQAWSVAVDMRLRPKLMANTNANGDRMITHLRMPGPIMIDAAMPAHKPNHRQKDGRRPARGRGARRAAAPPPPDGGPPPPGGGGGVKLV